MCRPEPTRGPREIDPRGPLLLRVNLTAQSLSRDFIQIGAP